MNYTTLFYCLFPRLAQPPNFLYCAVNTVLPVITIPVNSESVYVILPPFIDHPMNSYPFCALTAGIMLEYNMVPFGMYMLYGDDGVILPLLPA